jgi:hypothetical protein
MFRLIDCLSGGGGLTDDFYGTSFAQQSLYTLPE